MADTVAVAVFYFVGGLVQLGLALMAFTRRPRTEWVWIVAGLFLCNGIEAAGILVYNMDPGGVVGGFGRLVLFKYSDEAVFILLAYLALAYPQRPRALGSNRFVLPVLAAVSLTALTVALLVGAGALDYARTLSAPLSLGRVLVGYALPAAVWTLLLLRWAWAWRAAPRLLEQSAEFRLIFAAFVVRAANVLVVTFPVGQREGPPELWVAAQLLNAIPLAALLLTAATLALHQRSQVGRARGHTVFVLGFLGIGLVEGMVASALGGGWTFFGNVFVHLDLFVLRPLLLWFAIAGAMPFSKAQVRVGQALIGSLAFAFAFSGLHGALDYGAPEPWASAIAVVLALAVAAAIWACALPWFSRLATQFPEERREKESEGDWVAGQLVADRYRIQAFLGEGSCGHVHRAYDLVSKRSVVLKRTHGLDPGSRRVLLREATAMSSLVGAPVVQLVATAEVGRETVLVLEDMPGGSLATFMQAQGRLPPAQAIRLTLDILEGMSAAHKAGLAHGDVKPSNVLLTAQSRARLADFGMAVPAPAPSLLGDPTARATVAAGTLRYMAPEQLQGHGPNVRSDLYSVAAILYEMLVGRGLVPLTCSDYEARRTIVDGPSSPIPAHVPKAIRRALQRGLAKEAQRRFRTAADFAAALEKTIAPERPGTSAPRRARRRLPSHGPALWEVGSSSA